MEDFLSIQNYNFIIDFVFNVIKTKHHIELDISKYDDKIYYYMDKLDEMAKKTDSLTKHKANMFVANKRSYETKNKYTKRIQS